MVAYWTFNPVGIGSSPIRLTKSSKEEVKMIVKCSYCGKEIEVPKLSSSIFVKCPHCGTVIRVFI